MIQSKKDYLAYLEADRVALGKKKLTFKRSFIQLVLPDYIWKFQRLLREFEYYKNTKKIDFLSQIYLF